jgi:hypothetical protein
MPYREAVPGPVAASGAVRGRGVKEVPPTADITAMATPADPGALESPEAHRLRTEYRCVMCHKRCFIPCRLTASEFRGLVDGTYAEPPPPDDSEWE